MLTGGTKYFNDGFGNDLIGLRIRIFMVNELFEQTVLPHLDAAYNLAPDMRTPATAETSFRRIQTRK